ncbi:MAG: hypothetical protein R3305_09840, partial [Gammaproteobacteria bacterium]|nr:hypothetical protein [Gammaproteobacteria bacterium]
MTLMIGALLVAGAAGAQPAAPADLCNMTAEEREAARESRRAALESMSEEETVEFNERKNSADPVYAPYRNTEYVQPSIIFDEALTLRLGGLTFQITEE